MEKRTVFVSNIAYSVDRDKLRDIFTESLVINLLTKEETGESKGIAFVQFKSLSDARRAIEQYNGLEIDSRAISVKFASQGDGDALSKESSGTPPLCCSLPVGQTVSRLICFCSSASTP